MQKIFPRVLHIDDDEMFQELFQIAFDKWFSITSENSVESALSRLEAEDFDVVISDYDMPGMDGLDLLNDIKTRHPEIPVIFCTGQGSEEIAREVFIMGASDYFTKDFSNLAYKEKLVNSVYNASRLRYTSYQKIETDRKFREIADMLPLIVYEIDLEGKLTYVNEYAFKITGYTRKDFFKGINGISLICPEDKERVMKNLLRVSQGEDVGGLEYKVCRKGGSPFPALIYCNPIIKNKRIHGYRGIAIDISQRKEDEIQESIQKDIALILTSSGSMKDALNRILDTLLQIEEIDAGGIYLADNETGSINLVAQKGYSDDFLKEVRNFKNDSLQISFILSGEALYLKSSDLIDGSGQNRYNHVKALGVIPIKPNNQIIASINISSNSTHEFSMFTKNLMATISPLIGNVIAQKRTQEKLRNSEARYRSVVEDQTEFIVRWKPNGTRTFVNDAYSRYLEQSSNSLVGLNIFEYINEEDLKKTKEGLKLLTPENPFIINQYKGTLIDGSTVWQEWSDRGIFNDSRELVEIQSVGRDITDYKMAEEKVKKIMERATDSFLIIDSNANIVDVNNQACESYGYSREEFLKLNAFDISKSINNTKAEELCNLLKESGSVTTEEIHIRKDGSTFPVEIKIGICENKPGKLFLALVRDISERKIREEKLKKDETLFRQLANNSPDAIILHKEGIIKYCNRASLKIVEAATPDEHIGKSIFDVIHPDYRDVILQRQQKIKTQKDSLDYIKIKLKKSTGEYVDVEAASSPIEMQDETGILVMFRDITEQIKTAKALKESETRYRKLFDYSPVALIEQDYSGVKEFILSLVRQGVDDCKGYLEKNPQLVDKMLEKVKILNMNQATFDLFEFKKGTDFSGKITDTFTPQTYDAFLSALFAILNGESKSVQETVFKDSNGKEKNVIITTVSNSEIADKEFRILVSVVDITPLKEVEKELLKSKRKVKKLIEHSPIPTAILDMDDNVRYLNDKFVKTFGYTIEDLPRVQNWWELVYPQEIRRKKAIDRWKNHLKPAIENGKEIDPYESLISCRDHSSRIVEIYGTPVEDRYMLIFNDLTERKKMERELLSVNKELTDFTYRVSHDLKNPITVIGSYASLLKESPELFDELFERIIVQSEHLLDFINKLLNLSRAGKTLGKKTDIDLTSLIKNVLVNLNHNAEDCELKIADSIPQIFADPMSIEQVFTNIIENSIKYRNPDQKPSIDINGFTEEDNVIISISDNGKGLKEEELDRIFEPGYAPDKNMGTGFGLAIVKKIVEAHNGSIAVKSDGKNKGTTFILTLPVFK